jgi:LEA14-like dessication related protein
LGVFEAIVLAVLAGCSAPSAKLTGVSLTDIDLQSVTIVFNVELTNPNASALPLANVDYELSSQGNSFFTGEAPLQGEVPARGTKTVSLPARIAYAQLLTALANVKLGSVLPYKAQLGLSVNVPILGKLRLPVSREGNLPVPTAPGVELVGIKWDKLTLDNAGGVFTLHLTNRNQFPLELETMSYSLMLGTMDVARSSLARPVALGANGGEGTMEIPLSFSPRKFGLAALAMLTGNRAYSLTGEVVVKTSYGPMRLPFARSGNISLGR